jgi:hypothetical protein
MLSVSEFAINDLKQHDAVFTPEYIAALSKNEDNINI